MGSVGLQLTAKEDTTGWDSTFPEYMKWVKKQPAEIVNAKLYFVALNAMQTTKKADATKIIAELQEPSDKYPDMSLGELLTIMDLKKRGKMPKRSSTFQKNIANYIKKFENKRTSRINFLRSGWLPAVKKLDYWNRKGDITFVKRFAPKKPQDVKQYGNDKGNVLPAKLEQARVKGTIYNYIGQGKQDSPTVKPILQKGLDDAVKREVNSMKLYIERKVSEQHDRMRRKKDAGIRLG